jgi:hypothetical protein
LIFIANAIASIGLSPTDVSDTTRTIPLVLVGGVVINLFNARLAYTAGSLARTFNALVYVGVWATWVLAAFSGIYFN